MAAVGGVQSCHATLSGGTADTVTLTGRGGKLRVVNRHATNSMYVRFKDAAGTAAVAEADETFVVLPLQAREFSGHRGGGVLSVVGTDNPYSVELA